MSRSHGGSSLASCPVARAGGAPRDEDALELYGYRHFLGTPGEGERCHDFPQELLWRLARVMQRDDTDGDGNEQGNIPSGYTYLLQLVAHDCVHTPTPFWQLDGRTPTRNARAARLRLDTLYGLGPVGTPLPYAPDRDGSGTRSSLRLGPMKRAGGDGPEPPNRDIARVATPGTDSAATLTDPLIADPRNEDHAILAQMTALWHMVHNALLRVAKPIAVGDARREALFTWARAATTLVYRRILRDDLLERLLDPNVLERYRRATEEDLLDRDTKRYERPKASVPLEFSHGAMRFAHTMIRPKYRISDLPEMTIKGALQQSSARNPDQMPLGADWIVNWSHFFDDLGPDAANRSRRIGPRYLRFLMSSTEFSGPSPGNGLALHDLMSARAARLWSVSALHGAILQRAAERGWDEPFAGHDLTDAATRKERLRAWLEDADSGFVRIFEGDDIRRIAADPPLPFYIQFEAAESCHKGQKLGPLGSILVAETLFGAMLGDPLPGEEPCDMPNPDLRTALHRLGDALKVTIVAGADLPENGTMPALVRFVAKAHGLENATPPFITPGH